MKLEIDPKSHAAWTGGKQKILDKGRVSKFNKNFKILDLLNNLNVKYTFNASCNSSVVSGKYILTFKQIAEFCNMHEVEIQSIADGEVAKA